MKKSFLFSSMYLLIFGIVSVPLILNIKINELSNNIEEINSDIYLLQRQKDLVQLNHNEKYSIGSIEKLAMVNDYERLEISQKINKLEVPYKLKNEDKEKIAILGFGK
ncbi:MAG: hypothetical protein ACJ0HM_02035 [Candidatus Actinomarina sp.]